ncbi:MAG: hypothetical protein KBF98_15780 [Rhodoferax sp.]|nr:hypothetical protein [Rhodoferax sp.]MBP9061761.1 hypothetical protein [Rhodoferax sp.]MBP9685097.1 hypothetical protein [Rhodoferax sp.]
MEVTMANSVFALKGRSVLFMELFKMAVFNSYGFLFVSVFPSAARN